MIDNRQLCLHSIVIFHDLVNIIGINEFKLNVPKFEILL